METPIRGADSEGTGEVREDVDDHQHAPGDETERVQRPQLSTAVTDDDERDACAEEQQGRGDKERGEPPQQRLWRAGLPIRLVACVIATESPAGGGELER